MSKHRGIYINRFRPADESRYRYLVSLRTWTKYGGEFVTLLTCSDLSAAKSWVDYFNTIPDSALVNIALQSLAVLLDAQQKAERIAHASDEQGTEQYATKAHMRSWARLITDSIGALRDSLELVQERPPRQCESHLAVNQDDNSDLSYLVESVFPGMNWHVARGRSRPEEPLFGAAILDGDEEIGNGEGETPSAAMLVAIRRAREELARREGEFA